MEEKEENQTADPVSEEESSKSNKDEKESTGSAEDKVSNEKEQKGTVTDDIDNKIALETLKCISSILARGKNMTDNITFNQIIYGDNISGNAQKIDFGENNDFDSVSIGGQNSSNETAPGEKKAKIDLLDAKSVYKYLKENQQSPYCSFLIALSIFTDCQYDLVCREAEILYKMLVEEQRDIINSKGEHEIVKRESFEISRQELLENFGVRFYQNYLITFGGKFLTGFVGFSSDECSVNILHSIFLEFISLRNKIAAYLTKLICSEKISLYAASVVAIKKICNINPEFFINGTITRLLENKTILSDIAISEILCTIAQNSGSTYNADQYLKGIYRKEKDMHYYIIILSMCRTLALKREKIGKLIRPALLELTEQACMKIILKDFRPDLPEEEDFVSNIGIFYNIGNRYAEYYMAIVLELYGMLEKVKRTDPRRDFIHLIFFLFINEDYNESCLNTTKPEKFKDMIFIRLVLREEEISDKLIFLWAELLKDRCFSSAAKHCLDQYLCARDKNNLDEIEYKRIELFFRKLYRTARIQSTVALFLKNMATRPRNCNRIARRIYEKIGGSRL